MQNQKRRYPVVRAQNWISSLLLLYGVSNDMGNHRLPCPLLQHWVHICLIGSLQVLIEVGLTRHNIRNEKDLTDSSG